MFLFKYLTISYGNVHIFFRHVSDNNLLPSCLVYLDPFLARELNYIVWKYCVEQNFFLMAIPRTIWWSLKPSKMGAMGKYTAKMLFFMHHRKVNLLLLCNNTIASILKYFKYLFHYFLTNRKVPKRRI